MYSISLTGTSMFKDSPEGQTYSCQEHIWDSEELNPRCHVCGLLMRDDSLQKESEWEKTKKEFLKELKQALQNNIPSAVDTEFSKFLPAVEKAIDTIVAHRENEIAELVRKEKETWANQSIGWKAVESVENAIFKH